MSKEAKKEVVVCDGKDNDNACGLVHIGSVYQGGDVDGHFLKFKNDGTLTSTAERNDKNKIKLQKFESDDNDELYLITDPNSHRALKCNIKDGGTSSFTVESLPDKTQTKYNEVIKTKGFLFKKTKKKKYDGAGESPFYLYSYKCTSKGESLVLAVDEGSELRMNSPPKLREVELLNDDDIKYLFRIYTYLQGCHRKK